MTLAAVVAVFGRPTPQAAAEVPFPACATPRCDPACAPDDAGCIGADDYADYLSLEPGTLEPGVFPDDYRFDPAAPSDGSGWIFQGEVAGGPADGVVAGLNVVGAWETTTGRPDVVVAVLDSGIRWGTRDLAAKLAPNTGELRRPPGCPASFDCDGNGVVNVLDFAGAPCGPDGAHTVSDAAGNANGFLDGQDLILLCSDGVDDDDNGYIDDIAGWDFLQDDNDPVDDTDYGHGTGEASDQVAEANNGGSRAGVAPASMFVPLRVGDSFVADGTSFAQAVVYAVDRGVSLVSEALGTVSAGPAGQAAVDYAYRRGVPIIASAADEQSRHHNYPSNYEHTIWVNSIRDADGELLEAKSPPEFTLQNGCTNHGGRAWVAISSRSCSSEATARAGGLASLLIAHGRNLMDRGQLTPYPGLSTPFSAEEVRQIFRQAADDIDHTADPVLPFASLAETALAPRLGREGMPFFARHFATQPGWDQYTGYGRPDAARMVAVTAQTIPPEADLSGSVGWFDVIDPGAASVPIRASAAAVRAPGPFTWTLEVGCGVQPMVFSELASDTAHAPLQEALLHDWSPAATALGCFPEIFDPYTAESRLEDPDARSVTLRLQVRDSLGNLGEDRRTLALHTDPELVTRLDLGASAEGSPTLVDVDGDRVLDIVVGTSSGELLVLDGEGRALPGFPAVTDPLPVHASAAYDQGLVPVPREPILAATAADDLDGDGGVEIVAVTLRGRVYVFEASGARRPGFPVSTDPALSAPALRDRFNDLDPGIVAAPTLADLDPPGASPDLEILAAALDGNLYAWRHDGTPVDGFPVKLADRALVDVDPDTGKLTPLDGSARSRLAKIVGSPAVGDLDGDGRVEIVAVTNEEYRGEAPTFDHPSDLLDLFQALAGVGVDTLRFDTTGRVYALHADGRFVTHIGDVLAQWPAPVPMVVDGLLPNVATGVPGSPALADVDNDGRLEVAIFGAVGPVTLLDATGASRLPPVDAAQGVLALDFPDTAEGADAPGFPAVPASAGSPDAPFFAALGSGAFGDLDGDNLPEYAAPTAGIRKLFDVLAPGEQGPGDHQLTAWNPRTGALLEAFPRVTDDLQFLSSPSLADVSGDGLADVVNGSGAYLVRAYRADGELVEGFPKFTHNWIISSPVVGDLSGDGRNELVVATREGYLYVWRTAGRSLPRAIQWQGFGRDRRNTQNLESGVPTLAPEPGAGALCAATLGALLLLAAARRRRGPAV